MSGVLRGFNFKAAIVAVSVGGAMLFGTLLISYVLYDDQRVHYRAEHRRVIEAYAARINAHLLTRFAVGDHLAQKILQVRPTSAQGFAALTEPILDIFKDFQAINFVGPDGVIKWVTPLKGNERAVGLDITKIPSANEAYQRSKVLNELVITPPLDLAQGGRGVVGYRSLYEAGAMFGTLNLVFRIDQLVIQAIKFLDLEGHLFHLRDGDATIFRSIGDTDAAHRVSSIVIPLPNRVWHLDIYQQDDGYNAYYGPHTVAFGLGFIATLAVAFLVYIQVSRQYAIAERERRFRDFAMLNSDWFWETDEQLRFSYFSDRFEEVTGMNISNMLGRTRREVGAPGADPEAYAELLERMDAHQPFFDFEHHREHPTRGKVRIAISGVPVRNNGKFVGYRGVGRDVTVERLRSEELRRALVMAEEANQAKSEFLATMSHELRTPLNAILGFSEMIRSGVYGDIGHKSYGDYVEHIHNSGRHLLELINDVLDISAIEAGKRNIEPEKIDVVALLSDCMTFMKYEFDKRGLVVESDVSGIPVEIVADRTAIKQIILNILSNAVKYNKEGGRIEIDASFDYDAFTLSVTDTGIGIPADSLQGVTEPFYRSQANPHLAQEGTGLGLAIVKSLTEAHKGTLMLRSVEGKGTTVTIVLPIEAFKLKA